MSLADAADDARERHVPVLRETCIDLLRPALLAPGSVVVDATLGMGGHSEALLQELPDVTVIGIDRDRDALRLAGARLADFGERFIGVHAVYDEIPAVLRAAGCGSAQGILMDLGVSSLQIDEADRGFAYSHDAPLDMRMDQTQGLSAAEVLNTYSESDLSRILRIYGEERFAPRVARAIVRGREARPWDRTVALADTVRDAIPAAARKTGGHPAKRTFQALRIEVNAELDVLDDALPAAIGSLAVGGRMVVMSYHSLEDRRTKQAFARGTSSRTPRGLPQERDSDAPYLRSLTRGAIQASADEVARNPRAASVRLRAVERISSTDQTSSPTRTQTRTIR